MQWYPRAAHTIASAIPVLPLVGSTISERPGSIRPSASAASIIATPIRSFTDPAGLKYSSFATTSAPRFLPRRLSATSGVLPTTSDAWPPIRSSVVLADPLLEAIRRKLPGTAATGQIDLGAEVRTTESTYSAILPPMAEKTD